MGMATPQFEYAGSKAPNGVRMSAKELLKMTTFVALLPEAEKTMCSPWKQPAMWRLEMEMLLGLLSNTHVDSAA
jgi:hypothetical protein